MLEKENRWFVILYSLIVLVVLLGMFIPVMEVDAAQYAFMSKQMARTGDFLELYNRELNYLDKPPLLFWLSALSIKIFGISDFAYKLPSVLFTLVGVVSVFKLGRLFYGKRVGHIAALMFSSCAAFFIVTNDIRTDTLLISAVAFAVYHLCSYRERKKISNFIWAFIGIGIGMLAKGPLGLILVIMAVLPDAVLKRQWKFIFNPRWLLGLLIVAVVLAPMSYGLYTQFDANPGAEVNGTKGVSGLEFYFWTQSFGRITGDSEWATSLSNHPTWHFLTDTFLWAGLPWTFLYLAGFLDRTFQLFRNRLKIAHSTEYVTYFAFLLPLLALSKSGYQLNHYIYIVMPFTCILAAKYFVRFESEWVRWKLPIVVVQGLIILACLIVTLSIPLYVFGDEISFFYTILISLVGVLLLYLFIKSNFQVKVVFLPALAAVTVFLILNSFFYPKLLTYQPGKAIAEDIEQLNLNTKDVYFYKSHLFALDFYLPEYILMVAPNEMVALAEGGLEKYKGEFHIVTPDEGKEDLERLNINYELVSSYKKYPVTQLKTAFLNPVTREQTLTNMYLIKIKN